MKKIYYDVSKSSIVVTCPECPYWFAFRFDRVAAYRSGEDHLVRAHDEEPTRAARARLHYEARHAADT